MHEQRTSRTAPSLSTRSQAGSAHLPAPSSRPALGATAALPGDASHAGERDRGVVDVVSRLQTVVDVLPDAVVVSDAAGYIELVNHQTEMLFGYSRTALIGQSVERLVPGWFHHAHQHLRADYNATPRMRVMASARQIFGQRQDGTLFPAEVNLSPLVVGDTEATDEGFGEGRDEPAAVLATIRDVSERRCLERAHAEAEAATEELRRLQAITDVALTHRTLDDLLHAVLDRLCSVLQVDNAAILLPSEDRRELTLYWARGPEEALADHVRVPLGKGIAGHIATSRQPIVIDDLHEVEVVTPLLRERFRSLVGAPLLVDDRLIGVMHADSTQPRHFGERDMRLLQLVAERIALALDQARMHEAEQAALARAQVSEARFQHLMESNVIGLLIVEGEAIIETNDTFLRMVGYARDELVAGRLRWPALTPLEYQAMSVRAARELAATGASAPFEKEYVRKDGSRIPVLVGSVRLESEPLRVLAFVLDLTERKWLEREREEAQAREMAIREVNQHLDQFFSTAAHDIRNPVSAAKGAVQLARRRFERMQAAFAAAEADTTGTPGNPALRNRLEDIHDSLLRADATTERLTRMVGRLFDVARARTGTLELQLTPCNLTALVREHVEAQQVAAPGRTITLEGAGGYSAPVMADADRLGQVLANFLTNALKYSPDDQPVAVRVETVEDLVVVSVEDHGPGLPPEEQNRVWEPFHRAPGIKLRSSAAGVGSLGLGLFICKRIVELHGGRVGVERAPDQGSIFWFTLPLAASGASATPTRAGR